MWFSLPKIKTDELDYRNEFSRFRKCFFKVAYYWVCLMYQCFCQHVSTNGICQLSHRFCQTKHRMNIRTLGLLLSGQYIWTIFFEHTPPTGNFWVWKDVFCSYLNSYLGRISAEETSTSMKTEFWTYITDTTILHHIQTYHNIR